LTCCLGLITSLAADVAVVGGFDVDGTGAAADGDLWAL